ncbi:MAG: helix-turn-helix domain-containing protein [bacterium]|nr:helix-turn-helix domain-containing protein [bacterium]
MNEIFERLNCSVTQGKIYQMLLEIGPSIASMLAKRARIKRVTVYGALEGMVQKGLVESFKKNNVGYYQACDPEVIKNLLELQLEEEKRFAERAWKKIEELKQQREKSTREIIDVKGVISYYEGKEAVKSLIDENLNMPEKVQYCIGLSGYHALLVAGEWESYIKNRVKKGMKVLSIQADTREGRAYQKRDKDSLRETRLIEPSRCPEFGELNLIGDRIILYTSEENETLGVKIVHQKIAKILKKLFELAWDHSGEKS